MFLGIKNKAYLEALKEQAFLLVDGNFEMWSKVKKVLHMHSI